MSVKYFVFGLLVALVLVISYAQVQAAPTGATTTAGTQERWTGTSVSSVTTEGGNVTEVNVSGYSVTDKWAGFYGQISGGLRLADSSGTVFYEWSVSNVSGSVVYACNGTVSDWSNSNILPLNVSHTNLLPSFLLTGTDSFNYTFTNQETFTSASLSVANTNYTTTWQGGSKGSDFKTYALRSVADTALIWAAKAKENVNSFKAGVTVDYQLLAGVMSLSGNTQYYFYLELP
ncbi:MAG: hypothetical protein DRP85_06625 [Candidatus Makaraimicrobium thalassicum]|nr:MAG: hypothetical protein DRP85_06625 [Candidatus Omnitrophota bacterium]